MKKNKIQNVQKEQFIRIGLVVLLAALALAVIYASFRSEEIVGQATGTQQPSCTPGTFFPVDDAPQDGFFDRVEYCYPTSSGASQGFRGACTGSVCSSQKTVTLDTTAGTTLEFDDNPSATGGESPITSSTPKPLPVGTVYQLRIISPSPPVGTPPRADLETKFFFGGWNDLTGDNQPLIRDFRVDKDETHIASWAKKHKITTAVQDNTGAAGTSTIGTVTLSAAPADPANYFHPDGTPVTATATPANGYELKEWKVEHPCSGVGCTPAITSVLSNHLNASKHPKHEQLA
jgi:hypothetical protein